ncbi:Uncharacterised protein [Vibrio cholerae]|nr:Uncharacterised protein [Vibrio cholerae]CSI69821.1 Uncharacterised protein [Vibrio cholerae]
MSGGLLQRNDGHTGNERFAIFDVDVAFCNVGFTLAK